MVDTGQETKVWQRPASKTYKKRPSKFPHGQPRNPKLIQKIIHLRDVKNMRWRQIGELVGMSHQGPYLLYKRWREWAYDEAA